MGSHENLDTAGARANKYRTRARADAIASGVSLGIAWFLPVAIYPAAGMGAKLLYDFYMQKEAEMHVKLLSEKGGK